MDTQSGYGMNLEGRNPNYSFPIWIHAAKYGLRNDWTPFNSRNECQDASRLPSGQQQHMSEKLGQVSQAN
jgi:hypothetical protein